MTILYEIQASFVGIGKSTFVKKFPYPFTDDCIDLVDSLGDYFYDENGFFLTNDSNVESLFKGFLVLENSACTISNALKTSPIDFVVSSRSALVSVVQFLNFEATQNQIERLVDFYQARLKHMGIERVVVLDFGTSIASDVRAVRLGYDQMRERGRSYEMEYFSSFDKYKQFFERAESKKDAMVQELMKRNDFFEYVRTDFHGFGAEDYRNVLAIIQSVEIKMESDPCWEVRDLGIFHRVVKGIVSDPSKPKSFKIWETARDQHQSSNRHHPEFFSAPCSMTELDKREMLCDLFSCFLTAQMKRGKVKWEISEAANVIKHWSKWLFVQDLYEGGYKPTDKKESGRWPQNKFLHEKEWLIVWVRGFLKEEISINTFIEGLYGFDSIHYYVQDHLWHQFLIQEVAKELFPYDGALSERCDVHDLDKWDAFMVAAYTLKWIFGVEVVKLETVRPEHDELLKHILRRAQEQESKLVKPETSIQV